MAPGRCRLRLLFFCDFWSGHADSNRGPAIPKVVRRLFQRADTPSRNFPRPNFPGLLDAFQRRGHLAVEHVHIAQRRLPELKVAGLRATASSRNRAKNARRNLRPCTPAWSGAGKVASDFELRPVSEPMKWTVGFTESTVRILTT